MKGERTKWIFGTDHAGHRHPDPGREAARARGHQPRGAAAARSSSAACGSGGSSTARTIVTQFQRLGASCDYEDERFTLDEGYVRGGDAGLQGRSTTRADLPRQLHGQLGPGHAVGDLRPRGRGPRGHRHALLRRLSARGRDGAITVATVRPRRCWPTPPWRSIPTTSATRDLVGREVILPLVGRRLPVIADEYVKPEFGTGRAEDHARATTPTTSRSAAATGSRRSP